MISPLNFVSKCQVDCIFKAQQMLRAAGCKSRQAAMLQILAVYLCLKSTLHVFSAAANISELPIGEVEKLAADLGQ